MIKLVKRIKQLYGYMKVPIGSNGEYTTAQEIADLVEVPTPTYRVYKALLTQSSTDAPEAVVLNASDSNYLGEIVWTRTGVGIYRGTLTGEFLANKVDAWISINTGYTAYIVRTNDNTVTLNTALGLSADDGLLDTPVHIYVHD